MNPVQCNVSPLLLYSAVHLSQMEGDNDNTNDEVPEVETPTRFKFDIPNVSTAPGGVLSFDSMRVPQLPS